jgi:hypothetical protein
MAVAARWVEGMIAGRFLVRRTILSMHFYIFTASAKLSIRVITGPQRPASEASGRRCETR